MGNLGAPELLLLLFVMLGGAVVSIAAGVLYVKRARRRGPGQPPSADRR